MVFGMCRVFDDRHNAVAGGKADLFALGVAVCDISAACAFRFFGGKAGGLLLGNSSCFGFFVKVRILDKADIVDIDLPIGVERVETKSGNGIAPILVLLQIDRIDLPFAAAVIGF